MQLRIYSKPCASWRKVLGLNRHTISNMQMDKSLPKASAPAIGIGKINAVPNELQESK